MEVLLEEFYKTDLHVEKFVDRKVQITSGSCEIVGISKSGKTKLVKQYLLGLKKSRYLYVNCKDVRIELETFSEALSSFCIENKIETLVLDNYKESISIPNVPQLIITSQTQCKSDFLELLELYPLDYEEFLAYEHKYDSSALNHFFQLGGFPFMHKIASDEKNSYIQEFLQASLEEMEFDILRLCAKMISQKLSAFTIYERLKQSRKISKDKLYNSFESLVEKRYIHLLEKYNHKKAIKKIYLCDISLKAALSVEKNFARLFENMVFLELLKSGVESYYDEGVEFYLPASNEIILCKPFVEERQLFKLIESLEAFIFTHSIKKITAITMNKEGTVSHPFSKVEMLPFDIWALGD